ncbi:hypothetical protein HK101_010335 [Irineochytrium annulatum]|nr:hypothetical protein HK101_010335 [Irineochytrium annulatum]
MSDCQAVAVATLTVAGPSTVDRTAHREAPLENLAADHDDRMIVDAEEEDRDDGDDDERGEEKPREKDAQTELAQSDLRKRIVMIQTDKVMSAPEKAKKIQELMTSEWSSKQNSDNSRVPQANNRLQDKRVDFNEVLDVDKMQTFHSHDKSVGILGCKHYQRAAKLQGHCCGKWYTCRFCHDEVSDHNIIRNLTTTMMCMYCNFVQPASQNCVNPTCLKQVSKYYCDECKLWDDDPKKNIYHCFECGICRIGKGLGQDYFHCKKCNVCMAISLKGRHKCIERNLESDCPICGEYMFTSTTTVIFMPCGHCIHYKCHQEYIQTSYQCPTCFKSLANMTEYFKRIDQMLGQHQMPPEYANTQSHVYCNDCEKKSYSKFHFLYHKCGYCKGYNTKVLHTLEVKDASCISEADGSAEAGKGPQQGLTPQIEAPSEAVVSQQHQLQPQQNARPIATPVSRPNRIPVPTSSYLHQRPANWHSHHALQNEQGQFHANLQTFQQGHDHHHEQHIQNHLQHHQHHHHQHSHQHLRHVHLQQIVAADGIYKSSWEMFRLPDPFAIITVDGIEAKQTEVIRKTLNPYWNESVDLSVKNSTIISVQIFDHKRYKSGSGTGFLGAFVVQMASVFDVTRGGEEMITQDLKKTMGNEPVTGKLIVNFSTSFALSAPSTIHQQQPFIPPRTAVSSPPMQAVPSQGISNGFHQGHPSLSHTNTIQHQQQQFIPQAMQNQQLMSVPVAANGMMARSPSASSALPQIVPARVDTTPRVPVAQQASAASQDLNAPLPQGAQRIPTDDAADTDRQRRQLEMRSLPSMDVPLSAHNTAGPPGHSPRGEPAPVQPTPTTASSSATGALPAGWEQRFTPEGRPYFVDHNTRATTWLDPRRRPTAAGGAVGTLQVSAAQAQQHLLSVQSSTLTQLGPLPSGWEMRITNANRIYYVDHASKITTWDDPRLPSPVDNGVPQYKRDFRRKLVYFRSQPAMRQQGGQCHITVRRDNIFEDSYSEIMRHSPADLKKRFMVKFHGEDGLDYGGLSREFFFLMSKEMFNPFYCLFEYSAHDTYTLQINPHSAINPEHLNYFKFIGRVVGLAIYHQRFLDAFFISAFYKMILNRKITLKDMESVDAQQYRSLQWTIDNDIEGVLDLTFSVENEVFGELTTIDLKPGGREIEVTNQNKAEYVDLAVVWKIKSRVDEQFRAFHQGFNEIVPQDLISVFDERELELLIGGLAEVDVDDWKKNSDYRGYNENEEVIQWFWKFVKAMETEKKAHLLQFVTGTSRIPVNGFKDLQGSDGPRRFTIEKTAGDIEQLPKSHTCFNRLDLPPYKSYNKLVEKLSMAIEETMGFGVE